MKHCYILLILACLSCCSDKEKSLLERLKSGHYKRMKVLYILLLVLLSWSCAKDSETEKHQRKRDNLINVQDKITKIEMEDVPITDFAIPYILNDYLVVSDYKSPDKLIHIFDKTTFKYLGSTGDRGQGPDEITNMGDIGVNEADRVFYVTDHGKQKIFSFKMDSLLGNSSYIPTEKMRLDGSMYPRSYTYINDTLSIGLFIKVIGNSDYMPFIARWNMETGEINPMKYMKHPDIERKRVSFAASVENGLYVECYWYHDLMTIGDLEGNFKCNVYGRKWDSTASTEKGYYDNVVFCKDKIVASYSGENRIIKGENGELRAVYPTKLIVFDKCGDYIQTIETGHPITIFCYDEENDRIIMTLNDDMLFAYLDLKDIAAERK